MDVLAVVTVVVIGLMVGVELAVAVFVNPLLDRLPGTAGLLGRSDGGRVLGRLMPFWYFGSILVAIAWLVVAGPIVPVVVGVGLLVVTVVMSVTLLVPINNRVRTWSGSTAPADWRAQVGRWDRLHYGRTALLVAAFVLVTVGAAVA